MMSNEVVREDIPLLISKKKMKTMGMPLGFTSETAKVGQHRVPLSHTIIDHYSLSLTNLKFHETSNSNILHAAQIQNLNQEEKLVKAKKLHSLCAHQ